MNKRIAELTQIAYQEATKSEKALRDIQMVLLNIKISVAKIQDQTEARVLSVISDEIKKSIETIEKSANLAGKCMGEIAQINAES